MSSLSALVFLCAGCGGDSASDTDDDARDGGAGDRDGSIGSHDGGPGSRDAMVDDGVVDAGSGDGGDVDAASDGGKDGGKDGGNDDASTDAGSAPDAGGFDGFTAIYNAAPFQLCKGCHAPNAPGFVSGTESTQDWSTRATAYASLQRTAAGLIGNFAPCNGVRFVNGTPEESLLLAALDQDIRAQFVAPMALGCGADSISDMTLKIGIPRLPPALLAALKAWILAGAPDN